MSDVRHLVGPAFITKSPREILDAPITSLLGVNDPAQEALRALYINNVFDLAVSATFRAAASVAQIYDGADPENPTEHINRLPTELIDDSQLVKSLGEIANTPITSLRLISDDIGTQLQECLTVLTVRDLGWWPPYHAARAILSAAFGKSGSESDSGPAELIPSMRRYPTERVQYQVLLLDRILGNQGEPRHEIEKAGQINLTDGSRSGFKNVAVGAALTYTQSWYTEGLALGQLLHSVALSPGESTRLAVIDWSRRTAARITEEIAENEQLDASLTHRRSINEVINAVATESQSGFSAAAGAGGSTSAGAAAGGAVDLTKLIGLPLSLAGGSSSGFGLTGTTSLGFATTNGRREISSDMTQKILDETQQSASSTRSRWATEIREVSQAESETISTRSITNFNHMHALTIEYYEVVQLYRCEVELSSVTRCLYVPLQLVDFRNSDAVDRFRGIIARVGLVESVRSLGVAPPSSLIVSSPAITSPWTQGAIYMPTPTGVMPAHYDEEVLQRTTVIIRPPMPEAHLSPGSRTLRVWRLHLKGDSDATILENIDSILLRVAGQGDRVVPLIHEENPFEPPFHATLELTFEDLKGARASVQIRKKQGKEDFTGTILIQITGRWNDDRFLRFLSANVNLSAGSRVEILQLIPTANSIELMEHLEANALHYSQAIWNSLDAASIGYLLDRYDIKLGEERLPLTEAVDPRPIGLAGNYAVFQMPAPSGIDPDWERFLTTHQIVTGQQKDDLVPLPSAGVFAEAVLGRSNSAEKIDLSRFWNWQDSPIPITAPEISAISAGTRAQPEPSGPGQLGSPVVNIQNSPSVPDPVGFIAAIQALSNGQLFRDMSGLVGTQQLAQALAQEATRASLTSQELASKNMATGAAAAASAPDFQKGAPTASDRWGTNHAPANPTVEGGRLNYGRDLDERKHQNVHGADLLQGSAEYAQYDAGLGRPIAAMVNGPGDAGGSDAGAANAGPLAPGALPNLTDPTVPMSIFCFYGHSGDGLSSGSFPDGKDRNKTFQLAAETLQVTLASAYPKDSVQLIQAWTKERIFDALENASLPIRQVHVFCHGDSDWLSLAYHFDGGRRLDSQVKSINASGGTETEKALRTLERADALITGYLTRSAVPARLAKLRTNHAAGASWQIWGCYAGYPTTTFLGDRSSPERDRFFKRLNFGKASVDGIAVEISRSLGVLCTAAQGNGLEFWLGQSNGQVVLSTSSSPATQPFWLWPTSGSTWVTYDTSGAKRPLVNLFGRDRKPNEMPTPKPPKWLTDGYYIPASAAF